MQGPSPSSLKLTYNSLLEKPELEPPQLPKLTLFAFVFILDKLRILSESYSYQVSKEDLKAMDEELNLAHNERLEFLKTSKEKEKQVEKWTIFSKITIIMTSLTGVVSGIGLIATGAGVVAGTLLLVAGVLNIASQVMDVTRGWNQVAELLPGDDLEKKRAIVSWIQIGITALSLMLAAVTFIVGGYATLSESMKIAMKAVGGITLAGQSLASVGIGVSSYRFKHGLADLQENNSTLFYMRALRQEVMEIVEGLAEHLEKMLEYLNENLSLQRETFKVEQMSWR